MSDEQPRTAAGRFARFLARQDVKPDPMTDAQRQAIADLTGGAQLLPDEQEAMLRVFPDADRPKPRKEHPPEQGRLSDRRPEFGDLSDRVAEVNRRSTGGYPR